MGRCTHADHCINLAWCKTSGKCLKAEPVLTPCQPTHAGDGAYYRQLYEEAEAENAALRTALRAMLDDDDHDAAKSAARALLAGIGA